MSKNTKPPVILTPPFPTATLSHDKACVCSRCLDSRNGKIAADDDDAIELAASKQRYDDIADIDDNDICGSHYRHRRYDRPAYEAAPATNTTAITMKYPSPQIMKVRIIKSECPVNSTYNPAEDALFVNVPVAIGASIYPLGK